MTPEVRSGILEALLDLPGIDRMQTRDQLLCDLPEALLHLLPRDSAARPDLSAILEETAKWGEDALAQLLDNAIALGLGSDQAERLKSLRQRLGLDELHPPGRLRRPYRAQLAPDPWIDRPEINTIRSLLLNHDFRSPLLIALEGQPGIGKTGLAAKLAWDPEIRAHFNDGVIWVKLGQRPDVLGELASLATCFGANVSSYPTVAERVEVLQRRAEDRRYLLIVHDACDVDSARVFRDLAPSAALATTVSHQVACAFAPPRKVIELEQLTPEASIALLQALAPAAAKSPALRQVAEKAAGLPLALQLLAPLFAREARIPGYLEQFLQKLESSVFRGQELDKIIGNRFDSLAAPDQAALAQLAAFEPRPASFAHQAVAAVWNAPMNEVHDRLNWFLDQNLMDADGKGRLSLHQSIADIATARLSKDDPAPQRHAGYYLHLVEQHPEDWQGITAELPQIRRAWQTVSNDPIQVLAFVHALSMYHRRQGLARETILWGRAGLAAARQLGQVTEKASIFNQIGTVYDDLRRWQRALYYYKRALEVRERGNDLGAQAITRSNIGRVYANLGRIDLALHYLAQAEQALPDLAALGDRHGRATTLSNIGWAYNKLNKPEDALRYLQQALQIRQECRDEAGQALTLCGMGDAHAQLDAHDEALRCLERAEELQHKLGDRLNLVDTLSNKATIYHDMLNLPETERILKKLVKLEHTLGSPDLARDRALLEQVHAALMSKTGSVI